MLESKFKSDLIDELKFLFPGCIIIHTDPNDIQGFPDLIILYKKHWATLECKKTENASHRPNQDYFVEYLDKMSFSRFIYPENKEDVLDELQQAFRAKRSTRISKR